MPQPHRTSLEVRGYELDSYGHVNHAVYVSYLEHARWKVLESVGITLEKLKEWQRWPVIAHLEVDYLRPVFMGERLEIETRMTELKKASFALEQTIWRDETRILNARIQAATVNETGRPAAIPADMLERLRSVQGETS